MTELAFELASVGKKYSHFELADVSLALPTGQIMGLIGRNGAGKSTTIRILMGLVHQDRGEVHVLGHAMPKQQVAAKWGVGYVSEDMRLYKAATLAWHMRFMASIYPSWDQAYADALVRRFDLRPDQKLARVSHGERVKAMLLLALARRPKLLLLDEPTTGLDPVARREVLNELMSVLLEEDRTILFSSHNTADVEQIADQIAFIDRGRIIAASDKESFLDRWRRLRLETADSADLPSPAAVMVERVGKRMAVAVTGDYTPETERAFVDAGATVQAVERMTLEEIFLASLAQRESAV